MIRDIGHKIVIAGDLCPVDRNRIDFLSGNVEEIFSRDLLSVFESSAGLICNLETPLCDELSPILKSGPNLITPTSAVGVLKKINLKGIGMANNHILDQGERGLGETIRVLNEVRIPFFGAGSSAKDARGCFALDIDGKKIAFYGCTEHEFSFANEERGGANPFDALTCIKDVESLARAYDYVVVLYHGMIEHYRYPSPEVQKRCHALIDAGAHFVTCQHSHCIGCFEEYMSKTILYGQGDFCFAYGHVSPMRATGLLALFDVENGGVEFLPVKNDGKRVSLAQDEDAAEIMQDFEARSEEILLPGFVTKSWKEYCLEQSDYYAYMLALSMKPSWMKIPYKVLHKLGIIKPRFSHMGDLPYIQNMLQCEAHNELLRTVLSELND